MPLISRFFSGNPRLAKCQVNDSAHVLLGDRGDFVSLIHSALLVLDDARIARSEIVRQVYGPSTAKAVLGYKIKRKVINRSYQTTPDDIVGKMTITLLDAEMARRERKGGRATNCGGCGGAPHGAPRPVIAPRFPKPAKPLAIRDLNLPVPSLPITQLTGLTIHWSYTTGGELQSGGRHDVLVTKAAKMLLEKGVLLELDKPSAASIPDLSFPDPIFRSEAFRMLETAIKFDPFVATNVLRVIVCPFKFMDMAGITTSGTHPDTGKLTDPFVLINARALNPNHTTLLHEMIHTVGFPGGKEEGGHDPDPDNVFASPAGGKVFSDLHAGTLAAAAFYKRVLFQPGPGEQR